MRLPADAQKLTAAASTRPDFYYLDHHAAAYVEGPVHEYPDRAGRDRKQEAALGELGIRAIRFGQGDDWKGTVRRFQDVFGKLP